jgi:hypothetical protein
MDDLAALHPNGLFLRREALMFGYRDRDLAAALAARVLVRVRHGAYISAATWVAASAEDRYRLRGQAVCLSHGHAVALSHTSGAAALGLRLWNVDFGRVHVTRLDGGPARHHRDVVYHADSWVPDDIYLVDEMLTMSPVRSGLGTAALHGVEQGLVVLDSLIDLDLAPIELLHSTYELIRGWPHTGRLQVTVRLVEPGAESVGESRSRFLCFAQHLPKPELQFKVYDDSGQLIGITDMAWPEYRTLGEFDGKIKYGRLLKPGDDVSEVVFREKVREDELREATGFGMVRLIWIDLPKQRATGARIRRMLMRGGSAAA